MIDFLDTHYAADVEIRQLRNDLEAMRAERDRLLEVVAHEPLPDEVLRAQLIQATGCLNRVLGLFQGNEHMWSEDQATLRSARALLVELEGVK